MLIVFVALLTTTCIAAAHDPDPISVEDVPAEDDWFDFVKAMAQGNETHRFVESPTDVFGFGTYERLGDTGQTGLAQTLFWKEKVDVIYEFIGLILSAQRRLLNDYERDMKKRALWEAAAISHFSSLFDRLADISSRLDDLEERCPQLEETMELF